ncbi:MAG: SUMF1/EgtB/PvdO family nonheme iron enzyme [Chloroflexota bacterium]
MTLTPGDILHNRYRIVKLLGQGGFGAVYKAWDTSFDEPVALKESLEISPAAQKQFQLEAKLLFKLRHANLPRVQDIFVVPNQGMYMVMDYIEGEDLAQMLERTGAPLDEAQALAWIGQVCTALSYLHAQSPAVIHRDLKPANIRITPQGQAMLVDFGIAKVYDPRLKTTVGARAVTPGYSPPEQYGLGTTDAQSDVYALGATLYTLLTCQEPPASVDIVSGAVPAPQAAQQVNPQVSAGVSAALEKAMRIDRTARYGSVAEFWEALQAGAATPTPPGRPVGAQPPGGMQKGGTQVVGYAGAQPARPAQGIPWNWVAALTLMGLVVLVLGVALISSLLGGNGGEDAQATQTALAWRAEPTQTLPPTVAPALAEPKGMVLIPAGEFQMGSESGSSDERPVHTVYLDAYSIDVYEVTNARYAECVAVGSCEPPTASKSLTRSSYYGSSQYADYPVIYVTWEMADAYCQWRGGRLPTEAEWEKVARGGLEGAQYPWGDEAPTCERANYWGKVGGCIGDTSRVGSYAPNGYGLYDMAGNVWEWVQDWYSETFYGSSPRDNPMGSASGQYRVLRGGSWYFNESDLRSAYRTGYGHGDGNLDGGFRCVATVKSPE